LSHVTPGSTGNSNPPGGFGGWAVTRAPMTELAADSAAERMN
jgi:hypothetical protein